MALAPSERIKIIAEAARRLEVESWSLIDLTLSQFDVPTMDTWAGNESSYVIEMLRKAHNDTLIALAHHIGMEVDRPEVGVDPPFWTDKDMRIFLSHLSNHKAFAAKLQEEMKEYGLCAFVAHNDIEPTAEWQNEIKTALSTCEVLLALLHRGFSESNWTDQEVGFAMGRGIPVFAIRFDQDPYGFLGSLQAFSGTRKSPRKLAKEIFDKLRRHKQTYRRMAEIVVSRFEASYSFDDAKANMDHLEELETWNKSFADRVRKAARTNSQIANSWTVPERVAKLLKKWKQS